MKKISWFSLLIILLAISAQECLPAFEECSSRKNSGAHNSGTLGVFCSQKRGKNQAAACLGVLEK